MAATSAPGITRPLEGKVAIVTGAFRGKQQGHLKNRL